MAAAAALAGYREPSFPRLAANTLLTRYVGAMTAVVVRQHHLAATCVVRLDGMTWRLAAVGLARAWTLSDGPVLLLDGVTVIGVEAQTDAARPPRLIALCNTAAPQLGAVAARALASANAFLKITMKSHRERTLIAICRTLAEGDSDAEGAVAVDDVGGWGLIGMHDRRDVRRRAGGL
jgi:hypothetical protein